MPISAITHFVFVDFENVPEVDLGLVEGKAVHVTLLIGKNQKKLDLALVQQIHRLATQIALVEVGASGHNALDLTLAYYLGQAVQRAPGAQFCIVSKDKDFEPMIAHLRSAHVQVFRHDKFSALPFLPQPRSGTPPKGTSPAKSAAPVDKFAKLLARLQNNSAPRPKKRAGLLAHINTVYGNKLSDAEQTALVEDLIKRGVLKIDAKDKVSYAAAQ
jgi:hypothetical protein